jgi:hypothetical protein
MSNDLETWEQEQGETAKQYAAFCAFRDMDPHERTMDGAYQKYRKSAEKTQTKPNDEKAIAPRNWWKWAVDSNWSGRVLEYDRRRARIQLEAKEQEDIKAVKKLARETLEDAKLAARAARIMLTALLERFEKATEEDMSGAKLPQMINATSNLLRQANDMQAEALGIRELIPLLPEDNDG